MFKYKNHLIYLLISSFCLCFHATSHGGDFPPSEVLLARPVFYGPEHLADTAQQVADELEAGLVSGGDHVIVIPDEINSPEEALRIAQDHDMQWAVYGSVTRLGSQMSIDLRVVNTSLPGDTPRVVFTQGPADKLQGLCHIMADRLHKIFLSPYMVAAVRVEGNRRVGTDAILEHIGTSKGEMYDPKQISEDIKNIFSMGYFDDVEVDVHDDANGRTVTFMVREKPAIRKIIIKGNENIDTKDIMEVLNLKPYTVVRDKSLQEAAQKIEAMYSDKGYTGTTVTVSLERVSDQAADVVFEISEGEEVFIKEINIEGNKAFSDDELKSIMEVTEKKPWWTPSLRNVMAMIKGDAGVLKWDALERDAGRITAFYHNHGYVDARVGQPKVVRKGTNLYITIPVEEGEEYKVGKIDIEQDFFKDKDILLSNMKIKDEDAFSQEVLRKDILKLTDMFADNGYAHADIQPVITKDPNEKKVNIKLVVDKGPLVTFERISIAGNTITRDKVIRRELRVNELEPFSATGLKRSKDRLNKLGYFEDVNLNTTKGSDNEHMNLEVKVKERQTGTFSIGAGYSSVDKLIVMGEISQRNFLGKGQTVNFKGMFGAQTARFSLGFYEPYFMDTRLSMGIDAYNWRQEYTDYTKKSTGGALRFGYPLTDNLSAFFGGKWDYTDMTDIGDYTSQVIKDSQDIKETRAVRAGLSYDSRNAFFNPTHGWQNTIYLQYAGGFLGGDASFVKTEATVSYYHPLFWEFTGHIRSGTGYVFEGNGGKLPVWEKFFLGGIDSIRGYKWGRVSPIDPDTDERIGGHSMFYTQIETIFPLIKDMGLNGVVFVDAGNAWDKDSAYNFDKLKKTIGAGVRWLSPMGPLRVEWGYNLDREEGDDKTNWEFKMGGSF